MKPPEGWSEIRNFDWVTFADGYHRWAAGGVQWQLYQDASNDFHLNAFTPIGGRFINAQKWKGLTEVSLFGDAFHLQFVPVEGYAIVVEVTKYAIPKVVGPMARR